MSKLPVVLYHYDASPFATKVKNMLLVKRIPHKRVEQPMTLPRPDLSELLGIRYRRIPILAIGNDVYCDTSLIANVLERRFPASEGYGTLFPSRKGAEGKADTGIVKALSAYWVEKMVFPLAAQSLPYNKFDEKFLADRSAWQGVKLDPAALAARQGVRNSTLASHLTLLEEQLSDGREWLLDTVTPSLADLSAEFILSWTKRFKNLREVYDPQNFPKTVAWLSRVTAYLASNEKNNVAAYEELKGKEAADVICSSPAGDEQIGFDATDASRLGLKQGDVVFIMPTDNAKIPTVGKLLALSRTEAVIEVKGSAGTARCHFPRLEFGISPAAGAKL